MKTPGRNRFLLVLAALLLGGFSAVSLLSYQRARALLDRQITSSTLPLSSDAIIASLEHDLLQPVLASGLMADNTFLEDALRRGEAQPDQLSAYLKGIQQKTGAITTFLVSERSGRYYHPSGILKRLSAADPQDRWYYRFRDSGQPIEINIDRDTADLSRTTAFINVRLQDATGRFLGATGLGLDLRFLQDVLQRMQSQYGARVLLVDQRGRVVLSSDGRLGSLQSTEGLAPLSRRILAQSHTNLRVGAGGSDLYVRSTRLADVGWTLVVIQKRSAEQSAFIDLLTQNLVAALLVSVVLLVIGQLTLGRDQQRLQTIAQTDSLSGLLNRQVFEPLFQQLSAQCQRRKEPLTLALMDIDHFKQVNDTHGHLIGDAVICHVSRRLSRHLREADPLFRWGGEEFLLLMPGCTLEEARERLETIRRDLHTHPYAAATPGAADLAVSLSSGLTEYLPGEESSQMLHRADQALYSAKQAGRDRICVNPAPEAGTLTNRSAAA
ncbi:MAG: diguanylate cyclase [Synechococcaceae cyanobacterium]|nr:diguanylate cyclase [Synechococcaceae cyanobacterium]